MSPLSYRAWLRAARPLAQANLALPLVLGVVAGRIVAEVQPWQVALVVAFSVCDHLYIVFANDYADRDYDTERRTPFSGGSGVLVDGTLAPSALGRAALLSALLLLGVGVAGVAVGRPFVLAASGAAIVLLWAYSFAPLRLSYRGGGALLQAVGVGGVLPWLGRYIVTNDPGADWNILAPAMLLGLAGNITTALPDTGADRAAHKWTLAARIGTGRARIVASLVIVVALGVSAAMGARSMVYWSTLGAIVTFFLALQRRVDSAVRSVVLLGLAATAIWVGLIVARLGW